MGANHQQEIAFLASIAQPTHGLITNVGKAHLEGFGGFEGVKKGKGELYEYLVKHDASIFINKDNAYLKQMAEQRSVTEASYYGTGTDAQITGRLLASDPFLEVGWHENLDEGPGTETIAKSHLTGKYNLENILAVIAIGRHFKLSSEQINQGIEGYHPSNNRPQIVKTEKNILICDYYNANPSSMAVALENFKAVNAAQKVMILGDMFELGDESIVEHQQLIMKAAQVDAKCYFIGKTFATLKDEGSGTFLDSTDAAFQYFSENPVNGATVLIKGSRGMALEKLLPLF